jgi:hypothetical protein
VSSSWLARHKYELLLLALVLLLVVYPLLRGPVHAPLLARVLVTAQLLAGGWIVYADRLRVVALLFCGTAILGAWTGFALHDEHNSAVMVFFHTTTFLFQITIVVVLLRNVYRERAVTSDSIAAALCGYVLIGVAFGHAYCVVEELLPGSFNGPTKDLNPVQLHFLLTYFSFMTLTTVGYGDITPAADAARSLSIVEGVAGQFYLAVLVAELVGKRVAQALSSDQSSTS